MVNEGHKIVGRYVAFIATAPSAFNIRFGNQLFWLTNGECFAEWLAFLFGPVTVSLLNQRKVAGSRAKRHLHPDKCALGNFCQ